MIRYKVYENKKRIFHLFSPGKAQRDIEQVLNEHAREGWELHTAVYNLAGMVVLLIFKKENETGKAV